MNIKPERDEKNFLDAECERIINAAMMAALECDIPDEEINVFLRHLGENIGCDRIYVFADVIKTGTTENSFEWCNKNVLPSNKENELFSVDIFMPWYQRFQNGSSVVLDDIETLRETNSEMYHILGSQQIKCMIASPLNKKNEVVGFFGLDNPPKRFLNQSAFILNTIGSFISAMLKNRETHIINLHNAKHSSYSALSNIYYSMQIVDVETGKYEMIKSTPIIDNLLKNSDSNGFSEHSRVVFSNVVVERNLENTLKFLDLSSLNARMHNKYTITHEFLGKTEGWFRARFIRVEDNIETNLKHVVFAVESINEEKKLENHLRYLSETDQMTGIYNRGNGEKKISDKLKESIKGTFCIIDCDKFKSINDTYGHLIGDKVIIALADSIQSVCGKGEIYLRLGGDEFAIYLVNVTEKDIIKEFAQSLFDSFCNIDIPELNGPKISVSFGAAIYDGKTDITFDKLYSMADQAMYKSKRITGNSITFFE